MVTFGGKTLDEVLYGRTESPDPVAPVIGTQDHIISVFAECTMWLDQLLEEMSVLANKKARLSSQIKNLPVNRHTGAARERNKTYGIDLSQYANRVASLEAKCDRHWQAMDSTSRQFNERGWISGDRLIGQAWQHRAKQFSWPVGYEVTPASIRGLNSYLKDDIKAAIGTEPILLGKEPPF